MPIKTLNGIQTAFRDIPCLRKPAPEAPKPVSKLVEQRARRRAKKQREGFEISLFATFVFPAHVFLQAVLKQPQGSAFRKLAKLLFLVGIISRR